MINDIAIKLDNISKFYKLYNSPKDRLKEALNPFRKKYHKDFYALKNINLEQKRGNHPKVPTASTNRPEQIRIFVLACSNETTIGQDKIS